MKTNRLHSFLNHQNCLPLLRVLFVFQQLLLLLSYAYFLLCRFASPPKSVRYVVGVTEIASYLHSLSGSLAHSYSVCLHPNRFYDCQYDFSLALRNKYMAALARYFIGPVILGKLVQHTDVFIYLWKDRFLISSLDEGEFEFSFLKFFLRKQIVLIFLGSDIRSPATTMEMARSRGDEVEADYYFLSRPSALSPRYEASLRRRCSVSEKYADHIFSSSVDQASYFTRPTRPFVYFHPESCFSKMCSKYAGQYRTRIVHAPSSPLTKGTPLVRAAIARLKIEGYQFEYIELMGVSNRAVLHELSSAHIVLNEFYAHLPGVFGVEALASFCALMTSADETIEPDLPAGSNSAWFVTKSYQVYDNLKILLDSPCLQAAYASAGYEWASLYAAQSVSGARFLSILDPTQNSIFCNVNSPTGL